MHMHDIDTEDYTYNAPATVAITRSELDGLQLELRTAQEMRATLAYWWEFCQPEGSLVSPELRPVLNWAKYGVAPEMREAAALRQNNERLAAENVTLAQLVGKLRKRVAELEGAHGN